MDWQDLKQPEIQNFIRAHEKDDVAALALKKPPSPNWPYPLILDQIKARQKARTKLPGLYLCPGFIFPAPGIIEQASSQATARYKAHLMQGGDIIDLTLGSGSDALEAARIAGSLIGIDRDADNIARAAYNFSLMGFANAKLLCESAETFVLEMPAADWVLIDPQRRNQNQKGIVKLQDCSPDIFPLLPHLRGKAGRILLKTSPMFDIHSAIKELPVEAVHVIEFEKDCKELLFILNPAQDQAEDNPPVTAVQLGAEGNTEKSFTFTYAQEKAAHASYGPPLSYIYEPGPAFLKAGAFQYLAEKFALFKLHPHTHLYTSETLKPDFPGRIFTLDGIYPVKAGALPIDKANLAIRNFPSDTAALRKKLKLKDGGEHYVYACTINHDDKILLHLHAVK